MGYILVYGLLRAFSEAFFKMFYIFFQIFQNKVIEGKNDFLYVSVLNVGHDKFERFLRG